MKKIFYLFVLFGSVLLAQDFKQIRVSDGDGSTIIKNATVSLEMNLLTYKNQNGEFVTESLNQYRKIEVKKGSEWLAGLISGMGAGFLVNAIFRGDDEEIWYGAGPAMLIGGGIGLAVGSLIPRYKVLENENSSVSFGLNSIKFIF